MSKLRFLILPLIGALALAGCTTTAKPEAAAGMQKYGYPDVLKSVTVQPDKAMTVTVPDEYAKGAAPGYATFDIPAGAFTVPVKIAFLAAPNAAWERVVDPKLQVVANFAYLVTDAKTGAIIKKFNKPVMYSVTDPMITKDSVYWATTASNPAKLIDANAASKITGTTLKHPTPVSVVGWIITTPKSQIKMSNAM